MKHLAVFIAIGVAIFYFATRKAPVEALMVPVTQYTAAQAGNRFVQPDQASLPMTPRDLAVPGVTTVVYFHDETCPGCQQLDRNLEDFLRVRPDVAVRKVSIRVGQDAYSEAIRDYQWLIYMTPCILIFDKDRKLVAADDRTDGSGQALLEEWISAELRKAAQ